MSHGLHEHAMRYYALAHALTKEQFVVYAIDHYAHGRSVQTLRDKGFVQDYNIFVNDFTDFAAYARTFYPTLPLYIIGHSMGTLVTMLSVSRIPDVAAVGMWRKTVLFNCIYDYHSLVCICSFIWVCDCHWPGRRQSIRGPVPVSRVPGRLRGPRGQCACSSVPPRSRRSH